MMAGPVHEAKRSILELTHARRRRGLLKLKGDVTDLAAIACRVIHVAVRAVDEPTRP